MRIGWVGLGKLGGPIAALLSERHHVYGWDTDPVALTAVPNIVALDGIAALVAASPDLVFVAVPTPHGPEFSGEVPVPESRADFDYLALNSVLRTLSAEAGMRADVVVVSTVLPGTAERHDWANLEHLNYVYSPSFVSMGDVQHGFRFPEFWLIGTADPKDAEPLRTLYREVNASAPIIETDVTTAEAIKVAYNTMISVKIAVANCWGEIAAQVGADVDQITRAWSLAHDRILSTEYLRAGMGDGGPCHPRDLIAMSHLAREVGASYDLFDALIAQREAHTAWLASMIPDGAVLFGGPFKPGVQLTDGSSALLLAHVLEEQGKAYTLAPEPFAGEFNVLVTAEPRYRDISWPRGSTVLDPFGLLESVPAGVTLLQPGRKR